MVGNDFNLDDVARPCITLSDAVLEMTGRDAQAISRHFGSGINKLEPELQLFAAVWVTVDRIQRKSGKPGVLIDTVLNTVSLRQALAWFESEPEDFDAEAPDSLAGKDA